MFKRVAKRIKRQEEDEALGLDAEAKEILGLHDTDSDESSSASGSDDESEGQGEESDQESQLNGDVGEDEDEDVQESAASDEEIEDVSDDEPTLSLAEALKDPLYTISVDPEVQGCAICPGKLLKNETMAEVHRSSNAHVRRFKLFVQVASKAEPGTSVRKIVTTQLKQPPQETKEQPTNGKPSKRAEKRREKQAIIKAKRERHKKAKADGIAKKAAKKAAQQASRGDADAGYPSTPSPVKSHKKRKEGRDKPSESLKKAPTKLNPTTVSKPKRPKSTKVDDGSIAKPTRHDKPEGRSRIHAPDARVGTKRKRRDKDV
ncbi:uncharacterized protein FIBRA_06420 [Fibroporia radiculosa]|uniref:Zinc finger double-stranded RNA binding domain-containing protein n=1 Tax=Fibroporia radiculosa TaxID=599839 RepID=J4GBF6_9APHY|nr:uncharacterized protein FIBRA_06420 [Fibroporia radiculosa]CCM04253.1 predicted protein [Fibroporia radiculosa]